MARPKKQAPLPQPDPVEPFIGPLPEVTPTVSPAVAPDDAAPLELPSNPAGPTITFVGEGAEKVKFTINPKAQHYTVHADGIVVESL